ncbi:DUF6580 family putative transport protein [Larkinella rosea]|uniref:Rod shape-determining protein MreD n=1 Tax=Larkinella rosea TaxID=2025312 RepID=A0A3P1C1Y4_9BACT|nr:DUF6580 family putative transport protein [Larkinella rosea]RRB07106.1 hypothetical protein EHT25_04805 [Larkinella rosea]
MKRIHIRTATLATLIVLTALSRLLPHPYNFTPIAALALFGAATFERKALGLVIPLAAMLLSDLFIGFHGGMMSVYTAFALIWILGLVLFRKISVSRVVSASLLSSTLFFLVTNFAVWYGSKFYPQTPQGLLSCYAAGLAFFNGQSFFLNAVLGDLTFCTVLFGSYSILQKQFPVLRFAR